MGTQKKRTPVNAQKLLSNIDIRNLVKLYMELKPHSEKAPWRNERLENLRGGRCPFHKEGTDSFFVYNNSQKYHCYGCGAHGNAISFLEEWAGTKTPLVDLAKIAVIHGWTSWKQIRAKRK